METTESFALLQQIHTRQATSEKQLSKIQESLTQLMARFPPRSCGPKEDELIGLEVSMQKLRSTSSQLESMVGGEGCAKGDSEGQAHWIPCIEATGRKLKSAASRLDMIIDGESRTSRESKVSTMTESKPLEDGMFVSHQTPRFSRRSSTGIKGNKPKTKLEALVRNPYFTNFSSFAIVCNAVVIGFEVNYRTMHLDPSTFYTAMQYAFFFLFGFELALRLLAYKERFFFSHEASWNLFDMAMVCLSIFELLDTIIIANMADSNRQLRRVFGIFRMFRVIRVFRVLRFSPQLRIMIFMILESVKSLGCLVVLLASFLYVFSIIFTTASIEYLGVVGTDEYQPDRKYAKAFQQNYSTVLKSLYSCFKSMTNGQSWGELVDPLFDMEMAWFYASFFIIFILFAILCFLNVVTGVFVDGALEKSKQDREMIIEKELGLKKAYIHTLQTIFDETDNDESGTISRKEFEEYLKDERVQAYFTSLRIDVSDIGGLFKMLDKDGSGEIDFQEFIDNLMHLMRALSPEQTIQTLIFENKKTTKKLERLMEYVGLMVDGVLGNLKHLPLAMTHHAEPSSKPFEQVAPADVQGCSTCPTQTLEKMDSSLRPAGRCHI